MNNTPIRFPQGVYADWYVYPILLEGTGLAGLVNGETATGSFRVLADHDFLWVSSYASCTVGSGNGQGIPWLAYQSTAAPTNLFPAIYSYPLRAQIIDAGQQHGLTNAEVPFDSIFGDARRGAKSLVMPRAIKRNSSLQVTVRRFAAGQFDQAGNAGALGIRVHMAFEGYRLKGDQGLIYQFLGIPQN